MPKPPLFHQSNKYLAISTEEILFLKLAMSAILIAALAAGTAWAIFETNRELIAGTKITMEEAIKSATKAVPGRAAEANLGKDDGRTIWKIEVIDDNNKSQTVYVDAQTGLAKIDK